MTLLRVLLDLRRLGADCPGRGPRKGGKMRVLVTGGAGFIGSHYVRQTLSGAYPALRDAEVVVLDKLTYAGNEANLAPVADDPRLEFVRGDICDAGKVAEVMKDVDLVVHFAAESHVDRSILGAADFVLTNVLGTQNLLQAALPAGGPKLVPLSPGATPRARVPGPPPAGP